jgi:hypothetical protein
MELIELEKLLDTAHFEAREMTYEIEDVFNNMNSYLELPQARQELKDSVWTHIRKIMYYIEQAERSLALPPSSTPS